MSTRIIQPPPNDLGFTRNHGGDLIPTRGDDALASSGWERDAQSNLAPNDDAPSRGYWIEDEDGDLRPRTR